MSQKRFLAVAKQPFLAIAACALLLSLPGLGLGQDRPSGPARSGDQVDEDFEFVVLGHIRGEADGKPHPLLNTLLDEVRDLAPDAIVLTGDIVFGDVNSDPADTAKVRSEWEAVDNALATLSIPIYRTPGNHDISDLGTRDLYLERYGALPQAHDIGQVRFLMVSSAWIPEDGDQRHHYAPGGVPLDENQINFLDEQLSQADTYDHAFVFMHHLLWWEPDDSSWWRDVHPMLTQGKVRAVFSGDFGPQKFSYRQRDGVTYYQSAIGSPIGLDYLKSHEWNRLLAQQFDNYLHVQVTGVNVDVTIHTVGETSSESFTPDHWRDVWGSIHRPPPPRIREHLMNAFRSKTGGRKYLFLGLFLIFGSGVICGVLFSWMRK